MLFTRVLIVAMSLVIAPACCLAQVDEDKLGAWYTYAWTVAPTDERVGWQGTVQYRNWNIMGDLEQLLINAGPVFGIKGSGVRFAVNYVYVATGVYGSSSATVDEHRLFEEALIPGKLGGRTYLLNRLRFEQRWLEGQDFRNRFRWLFVANVPLNQTTLKKGAVYLSFYNELFINLERDIGDGREVDYFDRNRTYLAGGYSLNDDLRIQFGYMYQETDNLGKGQLQLNFFQWF